MKGAGRTDHLQPWVPVVGGLTAGALLFAAGMAFTAWLERTGAGMVFAIGWLLFGVACLALGGAVGYIFGTAKLDELRRELEEIKRSRITPPAS